MNKYFQNLIETVINLSESDSWESAVTEWEIEDCIEDEDAATQCVCGHENLRYLFTIKNVLNGNEVFPIGSTCIKKFERTDLDDKATIDISMFKLMHAVTNGEFIKLKGGLFTRKIIKYLYDNGCFVDNDYNQNCAYNDYEFFLKMFNKKDEISPAQQRKVTAIIMAYIRPFVFDLCGRKVVKR